MGAVFNRFHAGGVAALPGPLAAATWTGCPAPGHGSPQGLPSLSQATGPVPRRLHAEAGDTDDDFFLASDGGDPAVGGLGVEDVSDALLGLPLDADGLPMLPPQPSTFTPHYWFQHALSSYVGSMSIKDKRKIYCAMRQLPGVTDNSLLCRHGISVGEFCVWQILNDRPRRSTSGSMVSLEVE